MNCFYYSLNHKSRKSIQKCKFQANSQKVVKYYCTNPIQYVVQTFYKL